MIADLIETALQIEQEVPRAAGWNERTGDRRGYRNGSYSRRLMTPHGPVKAAVPRCRDGGLDRGLVFDRHQRRLADVDRILRHACLLGTGTRGTTEPGEQIFGDTLSHQTVSRLIRWLDDRIAEWRRRRRRPGLGRALGFRESLGGSAVHGRAGRQPDVLRVTRIVVEEGPDQQPAGAAD